MFTNKDSLAPGVQMNMLLQHSLYPLAYSNYIFYEGKIKYKKQKVSSAAYS